MHELRTCSLAFRADQTGFATTPYGPHARSDGLIFFISSTTAPRLGPPQLSGFFQIFSFATPSCGSILVAANSRWQHPAWVEQPSDLTRGNEAG
jgi:hypothetical protein